MSDVDSAIVGKIQLASAPVESHTEEYLLLEPDRIYNIVISDFLDFIVFIHKKYISNFFPETSVRTKKESRFFRNSDDRNSLNYLVVIEGFDEFGGKLADRLSEVSLVFVNEVVEEGSDYFSRFEVETLSEEEVRFVVSESEEFISQNDHKKIKDPFIFTASGPKNEHEVVVQGRLKKAIAEETRGREYSGIAYSVGARGDQNVAYLKIALDDNQKPTTVTFLVGDEILARRAALAYADPEYELKIDAHETIDAKNTSRWHLDSAELVECAQGFELEMTK